LRLPSNATQAFPDRLLRESNLCGDRTIAEASFFEVEDRPIPPLDSRRTLLRGTSTRSSKSQEPSWTNFDMAINRKIRLGKSETRVLRIRLEAYNVFNHPEYNAIDYALTFKSGIMNSTTAGQYTSTLPARILATNLRIEF
jgi:hypothetical protein